MAQSTSTVPAHLHAAAEQDFELCKSTLRTVKDPSQVLLEQAATFSRILENNYHTLEGFPAGRDGFVQWLRKHQGDLFGKAPYTGHNRNRDPEHLVAVYPALKQAFDDPSITNKPTSLHQVECIFTKGSAWLAGVVATGTAEEEQDAAWLSFQCQVIAKADKLVKASGRVAVFKAGTGLVFQAPRKLNKHHYYNAAHMVKLAMEKDADLEVSRLWARAM
jgi:hypothetical protein